MALRTRCRRGSLIFSMTDLSSSVSSPASSTTTCLRTASARSRTKRGKRAKRVRTDTMRTARTLWWSSRVWRSMRATISWTLTMPSGVSSATACASMVCVVTSSPTRSTRRSTLSTATRMAVASSRSLARRRGGSPVAGMAGSIAGGGMRPGQSDAPAESGRASRAPARAGGAAMVDRSRSRASGAAWAASGAAAIWPRSVRRTSAEARRASITSGVTERPPTRTGSRRLSRTWVKREISVKPIIELLPLRLWAKRKITSTASGASGACSRRSTPASNSASCSVVSSMKSPRNSSFRALVSAAGGSRGAGENDPRVAVPALVDGEKHEERVARPGEAAHASLLHVRAPHVGHGLNLRGGQAHDVGDGVHPHAHDLRADHDEDDHGEAAVLDFRKPELRPQIDDGDDGPPEIHDAGDVGRSVGQRRDRRLPFDLVHGEDGDAVLLLAEPEGQVLALRRRRAAVTPDYRELFHGPRASKFLELVVPGRGRPPSGAVARARAGVRRLRGLGPVSGPASGQSELRLHATAGRIGHGSRLWSRLGRLFGDPEAPHQLLELAGLAREVLGRRRQLLGLRRVRLHHLVHEGDRAVDLLDPPRLLLAGHRDLGDDVGDLLHPGHDLAQHLSRSVHQLGAVVDLVYRVLDEPLDLLGGRRAPLG